MQIACQSEKQNKKHKKKKHQHSPPTTTNSLQNMQRYDNLQYREEKKIVYILNKTF